MRKLFVGIVLVSLAIGAASQVAEAAWCWSPDQLQFGWVLYDNDRIIPGGEVTVGFYIDSSPPGQYEFELKFKSSYNVLVGTVSFGVWFEPEAVSLTSAGHEPDYILKVKGTLVEETKDPCIFCSLSFSVPLVGPGKETLLIETTECSLNGMVSLPCGSWGSGGYAPGPSVEEVSLKDVLIPLFICPLWILEKGDMDENRVITFNDVIKLYFLIEDVKKGKESTARQLYLGDMNLDGKLTVKEDLIPLYKLSKISKSEVAPAPPLGLKNILFGGKQKAATWAGIKKAVR